MPLSSQHQRLVRAAWAGFALSLCCTQAIADGLLGYGRPGTSAQQFLEMSTDAVRMSQPGQAQWMLYRDAEKTVYIVDDGQRSYQRMDKEMAAKLQAQIKAIKMQLEAQLAMLPPEQREMMKGMMPAVPDFGARHYTVETYGDPRKVAGYTCQPVRVLEDGKPSEEICLAKMASSFGAGSMAAVLEKMDGVPVEHRRPGAASAELELLELNHDKQAPERFALPAGYAQRSVFPGMGE
jgi:hypothetical protein